MTDVTEAPSAEAEPDATPEAEPSPAVKTAEIEQFDPTLAAAAAVDPAQGVLGLPSPNEWAAISGMAVAISQSGLCPRSLFKKPDDVALVLLHARDLRLAPTVGLNRISIVEGRPTLDAALMVSLCNRAGHRIWPDPANDRRSATAHIRLAGSDETHSFTFTIEDAAAAGLCKIKDGGKVEARSSTGKALPWEAYTQFMLWARAASGLIRMTCPEVTMGIAYTPDEVGVTNLDETGRIIDVSADDYRPASEKPAEVDPLDAQMPEADIVAIGQRIKALPPDVVIWLRETWKAPQHAVPGWDAPVSLPILTRPETATKRYASAIDDVLGIAERHAVRFAEWSDALGADLPVGEQMMTCVVHAVQEALCFIFAGAALGWPCACGDDPCTCAPEGAGGHGFDSAGTCLECFAKAGTDHSADCSMRPFD